MLSFLASPTLDRKNPVSGTDGLPFDGDVTYSIGEPTASAFVGRTVTLIDGGFGQPAPVVTWKTPSGKSLQPGQQDGRLLVTDDGSLVIESVQTTDAGSYEVSMSNEAGTDSATTDLNVFGKSAIFIF